MEARFAWSAEMVSLMSPATASSSSLASSMRASRSSQRDQTLPQLLRMASMRDRSDWRSRLFAESFQVSGSARMASSSFRRFSLSGTSKITSCVVQFFPNQID
jgi:hypothetical protein